MNGKVQETGVLYRLATSIGYTEWYAGPTEVSNAVADCLRGISPSLEMQISVLTREDGERMARYQGAACPALLSDKELIQCLEQAELRDSQLFGRVMGDIQSELAAARDRRLTTNPAMQPIGEHWARCPDCHRAVNTGPYGTDCDIPFMSGERGAGFGCPYCDGRAVQS
jgi:hypothetical protein